MAINFGILDPNTPAQAAGSFQAGQNALAARQDAEQQRQMNALALQQRQQAIADEQAARNAYAQSGGDPNKLVESLRGAGLHQKAMEVQGQLAAQQAAQRKAKIEDSLQHIQVLGQVAGGVKDQATYDAARQQLADIYGPEAVSKLPPNYDPAAVAQFQQQALSIKDQLEQHWKAADAELKNKQFGFEQSKFGQQQALERQKMGQAERHFQATQGLERDKLLAKGGENAKLTEAQGKAVGFASRAAEADKAIAGLASEGVEQPGATKRIAESIPLVGSGLGTLTNWTQSDKQQQVEQAQRNFINAVLRQESGATIADSEFDNARKQYFPQPGDSAKVKSQKAQNRATAIRALEVQAGPGMKMMGGTNSGLPSGWSVQEH